MRILFSFLLSLICFAALPSSIRAEQSDRSQPWPTTEFEVKWTSPNSSLAVDDFIKSSLSEIAKYYEEQGLRQPYLPFPDKTMRYTVYARTDIASSQYTGCGQNATKLEINVKKLQGLLKTSTIQQIDKDFVRKSYNDLAHELFHSIQASYDYITDSIHYCEKRGGHFAVVEGTATAAASLATMEKFPEYLGSLDWSFTSIGTFPYETEEFLSAGPGNRNLDYKTSSFWMYLAERFGGERPLGIFDILFRQKLSEVTLEERYRWLDRWVKHGKVAGKPLYIVFPEFHAEFASYVDDRYKQQGSRDDWVKAIYRLNGSKCRNVELKPGEFFGKIEIDGVAKNGATCIELSWEGAKPDDEIEIEAFHKNFDLIDRLHLGVSYVETNDRIDSCYSKITLPTKYAGAGKRKGEHLECSFGKLFVKKDGINSYKPWIIGSADSNKQGDFFARELGTKGRAFLVLTNMDDKPETTKKISVSEVDKLVLKFSIYRTSMIDGRRYRPVDMIQLRDISNQIPSPISAFSNYGAAAEFKFIGAAFSKGNSISTQNIDRYSFYGIKKPRPVLQSGLGSTFQTVSVADPKKKYSILPLAADEFQFGYIGPFKGVVSNETNAMSSLCRNSAVKPIGEITKSDDEQLRFKIDADLCILMPNGQSVKVDSVVAEFIYPFGRRAFPETAPQDVITPGLELYIDEYLKELARRGLIIPSTVLLSDGTHPNNAGPVNNPGDPTNTPSDKKTNTSVYDCTCKAFARIKKLIEEAKRDPSKRKEMMAALRSLQVCQPKFAKCKKKPPRMR